MTEYTREYFNDLDSKDELAPFRAEFYLPEGIIYLDGNSLGAMPLSAKRRAMELVEKEWGQDLITSWMKNGWFHLAEKLGDKIADLIGAGKGEVMACDATGINLHKLMSMALDMRPERKIILMEGSNFPTDNYMTQGLIGQLGRGHEIRFVERDEIPEALTDEVAVISLTHTHYKTGYLHDMKAITAKAHQEGALTIWDLCHSAGALPVALNDCQADFAVGCGYKYFNGGPGAPAFIYVARRHQGKATQPLTGWWGHTTPFAFERDYRPADNIWQMLTGSQPILSLALLECGLGIFSKADMIKIREKSMMLCDFFIVLVEKFCAEYGLILASPRDGNRRGSQVSFHHENGYAIMQALIAQGIIGDFRSPDIIRFGFAPLYIRYIDLWNAARGLQNILENETWRKPEYNQLAEVT